MKFKFKISESTTDDDIKQELDRLYKLNIKEIPLNYVLKLIDFLGVKKVPASGAALRFHHSALEDHKYFYEGFFSVHKIHKGGNEQLITIHDYRKYLYPPLIAIIEIKRQSGLN
jgi:hypothetical protein